ncbi:MAG TPA: 50S ribosomal protein L11 methyltransferase [Anaeromyxobacteraceae bacterium]|nr:50S ribosomal protein L11 methyltransferase [Anaeromyxobacteraceae bacterium]
MPSWSLTIDVDRDAADDLAAELVGEGASGVEVRDGEAAPMPGTAQPPAGRALLVAWFADPAAAAAAAAGRGGRLAESPDVDWSEAWRRGLGPVAAGRIWVRPSWVEAPPPPGRAEVVLDPGMAFGTGSHPTTALCLEALSEVVASRPGLAVLDVGTGSGLLAIAAARLGAGRAVGSDVDPVALRVARENAEANGATVELTDLAPDRIAGAFDLVVANILANTLVELAPAIAGRVAEGGVLFLAGILAPQEEEVRRAYLGAGLEAWPGGDRREGEWSLLALRRPPAGGERT